MMGHDSERFERRIGWCQFEVDRCVKVASLSNKNDGMYLHRWLGGKRTGDCDCRWSNYFCLSSLLATIQISIQACKSLTLVRVMVAAGSKAYGRQKPSDWFSNF